MKYLKQKTFTLGERSVNPCILSATKEVLGSQAAVKLSAYHFLTTQFKVLKIGISQINSTNQRTKIIVPFFFASCIA